MYLLRVDDGKGKLPVWSVKIAPVMGTLVAYTWCVLVLFSTWTGDPSSGMGVWCGVVVDITDV